MVGEAGDAVFRGRSDMGDVFNDMQRLRDSATGLKRDFSGAAAGMSQSFDQAGRNMQRVGKSMTTKVTLPIIGALGAAVYKFVGFEEAITQTRLVAGATEEQFASLRQEALRLGEVTRFSPEEAAQGMYELASAGLSTDKILGSIEGTLNFATAASLGLGEASNLVAESMNAFGLGAEDSVRIGDVLTAMLQTSTFHAEELGQAMAHAGQLGATANQDFESVAAGLAIIRSQGVPAAQAGVALRQAFDNLKAPAEGAGKTMAALGIEVRDATGNMLQFPTIVKNFQAALTDTNPAFREMRAEAGLSEIAMRDFVGSQLFGVAGQKAMALALNATTELINDGAEGTAQLAAIYGDEYVRGLEKGAVVTVEAGEAVQNLTDRYFKAAGTTEKFADAMRNTLGGQLIEVKGSIDTLLITLADTFAPILLDVLKNHIIPFVNGLKRFAESNPEIVKMGVAFLGVLAAVGPLLLIFGGVARGLGGIIGLVGKLGGSAAGAATGFAGLASKLKFLFGPVGILIGLLGVAIAKSPELRKSLGEAFGKIMEVVGRLAEVIMPALMAVVEALTPIIVTLADAFADVVGWLAPIIEWVANFIGEHATLVASVLAVVVALKALIAVFWLIVAHPVVAIIAGIILLAKLIVDNWGPIAGFFKKMWDTVVEAFKAAWDWLTGIVSKGTELVKAVIGGFVSYVKAIWGAFWNALKVVVQTIWNAITGSIKAAVGIIVGVFGGIKNAIDAVIGWFSNMKDKVLGFFGGMADKIKSGVEKVKGWLSKLNPFSRGSPSLVEYVDMGTAAIAKKYADLGGMDIDGPRLFTTVEGGDAGEAATAMRVALIDVSKVVPIDVNIVGEAAESLASMSSGVGGLASGISDAIDSAGSGGGLSSSDIGLFADSASMIGDMPSEFSATGTADSAGPFIDAFDQFVKTQQPPDLNRGLDAIVGNTYDLLQQARDNADQRTGQFDAQMLTAMQQIQTDFTEQRNAGSNRTFTPEQMQALERLSLNKELERSLLRPEFKPPSRIFGPLPTPPKTFADVRENPAGDTIIVNNPRSEETEDSLERISLRRTYLGANGGGTTAPTSRDSASGIRAI